MIPLTAAFRSSPRSQWSKAWSPAAAGAVGDDVLHDAHADADHDVRHLARGLLRRGFGEDAARDAVEDRAAGAGADRAADPGAERAAGRAEHRAEEHFLADLGPAPRVVAGVLPGARRVIGGVGRQRGRGPGDRAGQDQRADPGAADRHDRDRHQQPDDETGDEPGRQRIPGVAQLRQQPAVLDAAAGALGGVGHPVVERGQRFAGAGAGFGGVLLQPGPQVADGLTEALVDVGRGPEHGFGGAVDDLVTLGHGLAHQGGELPGQPFLQTRGLPRAAGTDRAGLSGTGRARFADRLVHLRRGPAELGRDLPGHRPRLPGGHPVGLAQRAGEGVPELPREPAPDRPPGDLRQDPGGGLPPGGGGLGALLGEGGLDLPGALLHGGPSRGGAVPDGRADGRQQPGEPGRDGAPDLRHGGGAFARGPADRAGRLLGGPRELPVHGPGLQADLPGQRGGLPEQIAAHLGPGPSQVGVGVPEAAADLFGGLAGHLLRGPAHRGGGFFAFAVEGAEPGGTAPAGFVRSAVHGPAHGVGDAVGGRDGLVAPRGAGLPDARGSFGDERPGLGLLCGVAGGELGPGTGPGRGNGGLGGSDGAGNPLPGGGDGLPDGAEFGLFALDELFLFGRDGGAVAGEGLLEGGFEFGLAGIVVGSDLVVELRGGRGERSLHGDGGRRCDGGFGGRGQLRCFLGLGGLLAAGLGRRNGFGGRCGRALRGGVRALSRRSGFRGRRDDRARTHRTPRRLGNVRRRTGSPGNVRGGTGQRTGDRLVSRQPLQVQDSLLRSRRFRPALLTAAALGRFVAGFGLPPHGSI